jgi:hypothetical protein
LGRQAEEIQLLQRGIAQLEKELQRLSGDHMPNAQSVQDQIIELGGELGRAYLQSGRRQDALNLVNAELKEKPFGFVRARMVIFLLGLLGMRQEALEAGRLAEFTAELEHDTSNDGSSRLMARKFVDGLLMERGLFKEFLGRLEARRASGKNWMP